jgi:hypothetical protein
MAMKFWLVPANNVVTVDDAPMAVDLSDVPANIYIVDWGGKDGTILYTDRVGVREKFSDPSPYQTYINRWMLAAQDPNQNELGAPSVQPITLAQAQAVKTSLINSLFDLKRQAPIDVTITVTPSSSSEKATITTTYDASDENVSSMQSQAIGEMTGSAAGGHDSLGACIQRLEDSMNASADGLNYNLAVSAGNFNTSLASSASNFNASLAASINAINANFVQHDNYISNYNNDVNTHNDNVGVFNSHMGVTVAGFNDNTHYMNSAYVDAINGTLVSCDAGGGVYSAATMPHQSMPDSNYTAGMPTAVSLSATIGSMPGASMSPATMSPASMPHVSAGGIPDAASLTMNQVALQEILNRRNTLKTTQNTKNGEIGALTSVAAVAAYDVTAGW